jgi:hypothetical protein
MTVDGPPLSDLASDPFSSSRSLGCGACGDGCDQIYLLADRAALYPLSHSSSLPPFQLKRIRSHLLILHRNIYIWSTVLLTCVSDLLHCVGWDPVSQSENDSKSSKENCEENIINKKKQKTGAIIRTGSSQRCLKHNKLLKQIVR